MVNILVVDDSRVDCKVAGGLLRKHEDWQIDFAENGRDALERIRQSPPDVVVTDLQMPELNGLELVREVQRTFPLIPVILMTAQGSETIAVEALHTGAASYVPKRQLAELLVNTVRQVLIAAGEKRTRQSLLERLISFKCRFVLNNDLTMLTSLVSHIQDLLRNMNVLAESERLRSGVALEEALLNAAYHGNLEVSSELREVDHVEFYRVARERADLAPYKDRSIYIDVEISREGLRYVIRDEGPGFDPSTLPDPTDPANIERPCGRGLLLMRTFMDEVHYNDCGNQVTLTKRAVKTTSST
jgi:CheY-like chemotaxis protein